MGSSFSSEDNTIVLDASAAGHLDILKYLKKEWTLEIAIQCIHEAIKGGHTHIIEHISDKIEWDDSHICECIEDTVKYGNLELLEYFNSRLDKCYSGDKIRNYIVSACSNVDDLNCLAIIKFIEHETNFEDWDICFVRECVMNAINVDNIETMKYIGRKCSENSKFQNDYIEAALQVRHFEIASYLIENSEIA
uniref:Ankyrin repeat protein n=1 Tax=Pithovirus LCPAC404 TaxID=2506597 RepID=A0A481ZC18_9VIRU|nr:MAG: ankyrin repeat protein [Pithovirus LCPAC404]